MPDDLNPKPQEPTGDPGAKGDSSVDYEAKYIGLNKAHSKMLKKLEEREAMIADYEEKLAQAAEAPKTIEAQLKAIQKQLETVQMERDSAKAEAESVKQRDTLRGVVKDKFADTPQLVTMWENGYLRERKDFADDAKYEDYLSSVAKTLVPQSQVQDAPPPPSDNELFQQRRQLFSGATPPAPGGDRSPSGKPRDVTAIQKEMWELDTSTKDGRAKFDALTAELDKALG